MEEGEEIDPLFAFVRLVIYHMHLLIPSGRGQRAEWRLRSSLIPLLLLKIRRFRRSSSMHCLPPLNCLPRHKAALFLFRTHCTPAVYVRQKRHLPSPNPPSSRGNSEANCQIGRIRKRRRREEEEEQNQTPLPHSISCQDKRSCMMRREESLSPLHPPSSPLRFWAGFSAFQKYK